VLVAWIASSGAISISFAAAKLSSRFFEYLQVPKAVAGIATIWFIPAFFGRIWLLLYVGCGLLLKVSHRLEIGVSWFNRRFDVENQPLTSIGFVAATCVALGYCVLAVIHLLP
jgi:fructose-specific phosphotransferase system IIC component